MTVVNEKIVYNIGPWATHNQVVKLKWETYFKEVASSNPTFK